MSFELLDSGVVTAFAALVVFAAVVGIALVVGGLVHTVRRHRPARLARHESVPEYYRGLAHAH